MSIATANIDTARHIARAAEQQIKVKTGMRFTIVLCPTDNAKKNPEQMLDRIASALGMNSDVFQTRRRSRQLVELRFLGALLLRRYFPNITLMQIGHLFGGQDHTSVMNALQRASELLETHDSSFTAKYDHAVKTVNLWMKEP